MESIGKRLDLQGKRVDQGLSVYGNKGSTDQHAYVQQLREGVPNFFVVFIRVLESGGSALEVEPGSGGFDSHVAKESPSRSFQSPQTAEQIATTIGSAESAEAVFLLLEHLAANRRARATSADDPGKTTFVRA